MILYFCYGSNLVVARLQKAVPSAKPLIKAYLPNYRLVVNKKSRGQSALVNIETANEGKVEGMLFSIDSDELSLLNRSEKGYKPKKVKVIDENGRNYEALAYISDTVFLDADHLPFTWYKSLILTGAQQHGLGLESFVALTNSEMLFDRDFARATEGLEGLPIATVMLPVAATGIAVRFNSTISVNGGTGETFFGSTKVGGNTVNTSFTVQNGDFLFASFIVRAPNGTNFKITYSCINTATGTQFTDQEIPPHPSPISDTIQSGGNAGIQIKFIFQ